MMLGTDSEFVNKFFSARKYWDINVGQWTASGQARPALRTWHTCERKLYHILHVVSDLQPCSVDVHRSADRAIGGGCVWIGLRHCGNQSLLSGCKETKSGQVKQLSKYVNKPKVTKLVIHTAPQPLSALSAHHIYMHGEV